LLHCTAFYLVLLVCYHRLEWTSLSCTFYVPLSTVYVSFFIRCSWNIISSIYKHELYEKSYHHWPLIVPRNICSPIFQRILDFFTPWPCSY
jgi:hypothetical protein